VNIVDSSAWLEYFADGPNANYFAAAIEDTAHLLVPSVVLYEVFKRILQQRDEGSALRAAAILQQGRVIDIDASLALSAAKLGADNKLAMAVSLALAAAKHHGAIVWTQDADFEGLAGVKFRAKAR
jgi:toxin FitB